MKRIYNTCIFILASLQLNAQLSEQLFQHPGSDYAPQIVWEWLNGNISREGINLDLEAMAATGLGGGILVNKTDAGPSGPVVFNSPSWVELTVHALHQADQLGLQFQMQLPAVKHSGIAGPWIMPENAMQQVVWSEVRVKGGDSISLSLPKPTINLGFYKDIALLAFPTAVNQTESIVNAARILDLTKQLSVDGILNWKAPKGSWTIVRLGHTVTDTSNTPIGLVVDKLSKRGIQQYYSSFLQPLMNQTKPYSGRSLVGFFMDSCTLGNQNWTSDMISEFSKRAGYDLKPYLLTFTGKKVNSVNDTELFRWDFQCVQSEMMTEYYFKGLHELLFQEGLNLYTHFDSLKPESRMFTAHPASMKAEIDSLFTLGKSPIFLQRFVHQPLPSAQPGLVDAQTGSTLNRNNTWFYKATDFFLYLRRCQYILQNGYTVKDAACFQGEAEVHPDLLHYPNVGHPIDYLSREALLSNSLVKDSRMILPDGRSYHILIFPSDRCMSLSVLRKLKSLLEDGLWVSAIKPTSWPGILSMSDQNEWKKMVEELWNKLPDGVYRFGAGRLFINIPIEEIFDEDHQKTDYSFVSTNSNSRVSTIHQRIGTDHAWFVGNNRSQPDTILVGFRITGQQPEWWNPQTGEITPLNIFRQNDEQTLIPLTLQPFESGFMVFRKPLIDKVYDGLIKNGKPLFSPNPDLYIPKQNSQAVITDTCISLPDYLQIHGKYLFRTQGVYYLLDPDLPDQRKQTLLRIRADLPVIDLGKSWTILFPEGKAAPERFKLDSLVSLHTLNEAGVRYFSGTASWQRTFELTPKDLIDNHFVLDLGNVSVIADVYVNGKSAGVFWKPPFRLEITQWLNPGVNQLEIRVTNLWLNRLIGDEFLSTDIENDQNSRLVESGLLGPVTLSTWKSYMPTLKSDTY